MEEIRSLKAGVAGAGVEGVGGTVGAILTGQNPRCSSALG